MPRVFTSANDPVDFCKKHFPTEGAAEAKHGHVGDGPDGRGNCFSHDAEHPPYSFVADPVSFRDYEVEKLAK